MDPEWAGLVVGDPCINVTDNSTLELDYNLADTYTLVCGLLVFIIVLPFVLFEFRCFPIGTTSAVLMGGTLMVTCNIVTQDEAYKVIGSKGNLTTIFLLLGMMLLAQYFEREQLLEKILRHFLKPDHSFCNYLWRVCLLSFVLSALFTNDASCAILTPLLLKFWEVQERPEAELETILLGIATSSNIGSVSTIFGNPQMALIAAKTAVPPFTASRLDLRTCLVYLGPLAVLAYFINLFFLLLHHRLKSRGGDKNQLLSEVSQNSQEMAGLTKDLPNGNIANGGLVKYDARVVLDYAQDCKVNMPPPLETIHEDQVLEIISSRSVSVITVSDHGEDSDSGSDDSREEEHLNAKANGGVRADEDFVSNTAENLTSINDIQFKPSPLQQSQNGQLTGCPNSNNDPHGLVLSDKIGVYRSLSAISVAEFIHSSDEMNYKNLRRNDQGFGPSDSLFFKIFLCFMLLLVIALFLGSTDEVPFDMGLVPIGAAMLVVTMDALVNKQNATMIMKRVDWSILMMFFGIFVWMHGLNATRVPRWVWDKLGLSHASSQLSPISILILTAFIIIGSNVFSNVPLTLIVLEQLEPCRNELALVLYLAWVATIAGNLTLFGSVANLIVSQKGQQTLSHRLSFFTYLRYGFFTTLFIITIGVLILYGFLLIT